MTNFAYFLKNKKKIKFKELFYYFIVKETICKWTIKRTFTVH
jgi:hypothetical protein